jgi:hypothetical protein
MHAVSRHGILKHLVGQEKHIVFLHSALQSQTFGAGGPPRKKAFASGHNPGHSLSPVFLFPVLKPEIKRKNGMKVKRTPRKVHSCGDNPNVKPVWHNPKHSRIKVRVG